MSEDPTSKPQQGPGWHREWATSPFTEQRFQYIVLEGHLEPWEGLDDVLVDKGYRSRAELQASIRREIPADEEAYAF